MTAREGPGQAGHTLPHRPINFRDWFTPGRFAAILGSLIAVTFLDVVGGQRTFFYRDFGVFTYLMAQYFREITFGGGNCRCGIR